MTDSYLQKLQNWFCRMRSYRAYELDLTAPILTESQVPGDFNLLRCSEPDLDSLDWGRGESGERRKQLIASELASGTTVIVAESEGVVSYGRCVSYDRIWSPTRTTDLGEGWAYLSNSFAVGELDPATESAVLRSCLRHAAEIGKRRVASFIWTGDDSALSRMAALGFNALFDVFRLRLLGKFWYERAPKNAFERFSLPA